MSKLVRGRTVICEVKENHEISQIEDGAVLVQNGRITDFGSFDRLNRETDDAEIVGGPDYIVFPGFVNSHHHLGITPLQSGTPDLPLELWIPRRLGSRTVDLYLDTLYSAFEMIRSGVTTVQHLHNRVPGTFDDVRRGADQVISAYRDLGMRVSYSYGIPDQNQIVYESDESFLARLPASLAAELRSFLANTSLPMEDNFSLFASLLETYRDDPLVSIQLAPPNLHWCSDAALRRFAEFSLNKDVVLHMHLLETPYQRAYARERTGGSAVQHINRFGLLGPRMTLGHAIWMTEADLDLVAETDTRICHNCSSNMRLCSGTAPLNAMIRRGIKIAIGIDEAGINDDRDMLQEMRQVLRIHRVPGIDAKVPTPAEVFQMGTEYGGLTTPFGTRIGKIAKGRAADLVLAKWSQISYPYLDPKVTVVDALLQRGRSVGIDTVIVEGQIVFSGGRFTRVDEEAAIRQLAKELTIPPSGDDVRHRIMSESLLEYARAFYRENPTYAKVKQSPY